MISYACRFQTTTTMSNISEFINDATSVEFIFSARKVAMMCPVLDNMIAGMFTSEEHLPAIRRLQMFIRLQHNNTERLMSTDPSLFDDMFSLFVQLEDRLNQALLEILENAEADGEPENIYLNCAHNTRMVFEGLSSFIQCLKTSGCVEIVPSRTQLSVRCVA